MGSIINVNGLIATKNYVKNLADHLHPIVEMLFSICDALFQECKAPVYTDHIVQDWFFEHENLLSHVQSQDLNIIERL